MISQTFFIYLQKRIKIDDIFIDINTKTTVMQQKIDVRKTFEEIEHIICQNKQNSLLVENLQKLPKDKNGYTIMTKEQVNHFFPNAMPAEDFFYQLENYGRE